jgi:hypothetical protein
VHRCKQESQCEGPLNVVIPIALICLFAPGFVSALMSRSLADRLRERLRILPGHEVGVSLFELDSVLKEYDSLSMQVCARNPEIEAARQEMQKWSQRALRSWIAFACVITLIAVLTLVYRL